MRKKSLIVAMTLAMGVASTGMVMAEGEQLQFSASQKLSDDQALDMGMAFKTKLIRLGNGALISVFGDGANDSASVYDVKGQNERAPRDIFIRTCNSIGTDCGDEANWSAPVNVSNTAGQTSINTNWTGDTNGNSDRTAYYGDSDKPNISNGGSNIMITWVDKFCPGGDQRTVTYVTRENREIPFSCTYARYATVSGGGAITWGAGSETGGIQLSDGSRDAKQDVSKVNLAGKAVITWQEDRQGLQLGAADGPGDGASGATASHGTDIWMTTATNEITNVDTGAGKVTGLNKIVRLTNNTISNLSGGHHTIKDAAGVDVDGAAIDSGQTAATRANTGLFDGQVIVAYEETKGSEEIEYGKYVRYHAFGFPGNDTALDGAAGQAGCVISNPAENARRVRFVAQGASTEGKTSDMVMGIFWKEGQYDKGGPSDIMLRLSRNDSFAAADMVPAVDPACEAATYEAAAALNNTPALNISSRTGQAGLESLADTTETFQNENALAHRGAIVRDTLFIGYSYTGDWIAESLGTDANYDFWTRTYVAAAPGAGDWTAEVPKNVSRLPDTSKNVREPRIVKTPYSTDGTYDPDAFVVAWGTQTNEDYFGEPEEEEIYYTRTFDKGDTFEPIVMVANSTPAHRRFESQLRPTPDGLTVYAAWNEIDATDAVDAVFSKGTSGVGTGEDAYDTSWYTEYVVPSTGDDTTTTTTSSSGGSASTFSGLLLPALIGLVMGIVGFLGLRRLQK